MTVPVKFLSLVIEKKYKTCYRIFYFLFIKSKEKKISKVWVNTQ